MAIDEEAFWQLVRSAGLYEHSMDPTIRPGWWGAPRGTLRAFASLVAQQCAAQIEATGRGERASAHVYPNSKEAAVQDAWLLAARVARATFKAP